MKKYEEEISDKEFIELYIRFNLGARVNVATACLNCFSMADEANKKAIAIEVLSQYIASLETLAMIYHAMREKTKQPEKSFLYHYQSIFIKENENAEYSTKKVIEELEDLESQDIDYIRAGLGLPDFKTLKVVPDLIDENSNEESIKNQYDAETKTILTQFKSVLKNRVKDKDGNELNLVNVYNKIKHGYFVIDDKDNGWIKLPIRFENISKDSTRFEYYWYECEEGKVRGLVDKMVIIKNHLNDFLSLYLRCLGAFE